MRGREGSYDVAIEDGKVAAVEPKIDASPEREFDGTGCILTPSFVNSHVHLDKCMLGDVMRTNESLSLQEAIEITWDHKRSYTVEEIADRATPAVEAAIANGTGVIRAFADVGSVGGNVPVQGLLELKRRFAGRVKMEVVAFPQEGIPRDPGADRLMEEAMELGADIVGGLPWYELTDKYMRDHIDFCFELAKKHDVDIHMLVDDTDTPNSRSLEYLALRSDEEGYHGRVSASHCCALSAYDHVHAEKVIGMVKQGGVTIVSNTQVNLIMGGRNDRGLVRRGNTRVRELLEAGVNIATAQDDVNDPYYPFGRNDQIEVAQYMAHVARFSYPSELETVFDMITYNGAKAMRLENYGVEVGSRADLALIEAPSVREALRLIPARKAVFFGGKLVAETEIKSVVHPE